MRVAVIGAGAVGLCSAWYLTNAGHTVTVFERGAPESDRCSLGNAGMIVPSHFVPLAAPGMVAQGLKMMARRDSPFRIKPALDADLARWCAIFMKHCTEDHVEKCTETLRDLHLESAQLFREMANSWDNVFGLESKGVLVVCNTEKGLEHEKETAEMARNLGLKVDTLSTKELQEKEPRISFEAVGAIHFKDDCHLAPHVFVSTLQFALMEAGASFEWNNEPDVETLAGSNSEFDFVVIAAGTWSGKLAKSIGLDVPMQPGKGMSVALTEPRVVPQTPMLLHEAKVAITPMAGGIRFGGTMELGEWGKQADLVRFRAMVRSVAAYLPNFSAEMEQLESECAAEHIWTGLRPCSPDGMPYIGHHSKNPKVIFATGHGMMGLSLAPITGKMVTGLVAGQATNPLLRPDRFE